MATERQPRQYHAFMAAFKRQSADRLRLSDESLTEEDREFVRHLLAEALQHDRLAEQER